MKFIKIVFTFLILSSSVILEAQTVSTDCETAAPLAPRRPENCQAYDIANCWAFGAVTYTTASAQRISGVMSMRSNSPTSLDPGACWVKSPWLKPGSGNITFKIKFEAAAAATIRRVILSYCPYNASSVTAHKEGAMVLFDSISYTPNLPLTAQSLSFAVPSAIANSGQPYKIRISFVGSGGTTRYNMDDFVIPGTYWADPSNSCLPLPLIQDADSDGVADVDDAYPNDAARAYNNYYPAAGKGTLMYEDLWPAMGDYDFNDYVCSYRYNLVTNASNKVVEMKLNLTSRAIGASNKNGFAFQLDYLDPSKITAVSGTQTNSAAWVSNAGNGTENGQDYANILVFDDAFKILPSPGGSGVNVDLNNPYATPVETNITVSFKTVSGEAITVNDISFNPYIIVNQERGREVHLPDFLPSKKANQELFGTDDDDSMKGLGKMVAMKYYKTKSNLPWALSVEGEVPYPTEKTDILGAYLHLAEWAESNGTLFTDWYTNGEGYRNNTKLYIRP